ncbi:MAG: hypothetical protein ACRDKX_04760, partial [Solirubrobacterales bacterium]
MRRARERRSEREGRPLRRPGRKTQASLITGAALGAGALLAPPAQAATYTVTNLYDPGSGYCDAYGCTLREAIDDANANPYYDRIEFASGLSGSINLYDGDIEITDHSLTIAGPGNEVITVNGNYDNRIFDLYGFNSPYYEVSISGLTLRHGAVYGRGGAIRNEGFEGDAASLTIEDSVITDNFAFGVGGAIFHADAYQLTI